MLAAWREGYDKPRQHIQKQKHHFADKSLYSQNYGFSSIQEINPEYSLQGLMLKLKLQYFGYLMRRADSPEKTLMLGKIEGKSRSGQQKKRWLDASPSQWT